MSTSNSPRSDILAEAISVLSDDDEFDEPLQARAHMAENIISQTDLEFEDLVGATALSLTGPLGVLVGATRERIKTIVSGRPGLSMVDIEDKFGFVSSPEELITVAAYQVSRDGLLDQEKEQRLRYLYGAASAYLDFEIGAGEFSDLVTKRATNNPPSIGELPASVQAAELKERDQLDVEEAPSHVQWIFTLDPDLEHSPEEATVDEGQAEYWGCPYCEYTADSLGSTGAHFMSTSGGGHDGATMKKPKHHVPGYNGSGELIIAQDANEGPWFKEVRPARALDEEHWYSEAQREAAQASVPIPTRHNSEELTDTPDAEDIVATSDAATDDHEEGSSDPDDVGWEPVEDPSPSGSASVNGVGEKETTAEGPPSKEEEQASDQAGEQASEATARAEADVEREEPDTVSDSPSSDEDPDPAEADRSAPSEPTPDQIKLVTTPEEDGSTPVEAPGEGDADIHQSGMTNGDAPDSVVAEADTDGPWTSTAVREQDAQRPTETSPEGPGIDEEVGTILPDSGEEEDLGASSDEKTAVQEEGAGTDEAAALIDDAEEDASGSDDDTSRTSEARSDETPSSAKTGATEEIAPGLLIGDTGAVEIRGVDNQEALIETAVALDQHEGIEESRKGRLMGTLIDRSSVDVEPATVKEAVINRRPEEDEQTGSAATPLGQRLQSDQVSRPAQSGASPDRIGVDAEAGVLRTPVGEVSTQGDLADVAVEIATAERFSQAEKRDLITELGGNAHRVGIQVGAEELMELVRRRTDTRLDQGAPDSDSLPGTRADRSTDTQGSSLQREDVIRRAVEILSSETSTQEKSQAISTLLDEAAEHGVDIGKQELSDLIEAYKSPEE